MQFQILHLSQNRVANLIETPEINFSLIETVVNKKYIALTAFSINSKLTSRISINFATRFCLSHLTISVKFETVHLQFFVA